MSGLPTPYYDRDGITIYNADCREILPLLEPNSIDLVLTDPPYGIGFQKGAGGKGAHNRRNLEPIRGDEYPFDPDVLLRFANVITWGANHYAKRLPEEGSWLAWDKLGGMESFDSFSDVEFAWRSKKAADRLFSQRWKGIIRDGVDRNERKLHISQKPLELMKWCIGFYPDALTILDPFMGSGTTLRAAKDLGRKAIGIEIEERYCEIAVKRLSQQVLPLETAS